MKDNEDHYQIRTASAEDVSALEELSLQLGYTTTANTITQALRHFSNSTESETVVITENEKVLGWMTLRTIYGIESPPFLQIAGLVTSQEYRGKGLGKKLVRYAESVAKKRGMTSVALYTNQKRTDAHAFYEKIGFEKIKSSFFYKKEIG